MLSKSRARSDSGSRFGASSTSGSLSRKSGSIVALELGLTYVDTSLGAIGGQPAGSSKYQFRFTGNTCSEDLVCLLEEMTVRTGIDVHAMIDNGKRAEEIIGQRLRSNVIRSGPVNHAPRPYTPEAAGPDVEVATSAHEARPPLPLEG